MSENREIQLPEDLCAAAEARFAKSFGTLEEFLTFVLRNLLKDEATKMDAAEQELVEQRLRELGYL